MFCPIHAILPGDPCLAKGFESCTLSLDATAFLGMSTSIPTTRYSSKSKASLLVHSQSIAAALPSLHNYLCLPAVFVSCTRYETPKMCPPCLASTFCSPEDVPPKARLSHASSIETKNIRQALAKTTLLSPINVGRPYDKITIASTVFAHRHHFGALFSGSLHTLEGQLTDNAKKLTHNTKERIAGCLQEET